MSNPDHQTCLCNPYHKHHALACPFKLVGGITQQCKCDKEHVCAKYALHKFKCLQCDKFQLVNVANPNEQMNLKTGEYDKMKVEGVLNVDGPVHHLMGRNPKITFTNKKLTAEEYYMKERNRERNFYTPSELKQEFEDNVNSVFPNGGRKDPRLCSVLDNGKQIIAKKVKSGKDMVNICVGESKPAFDFKETNIKNRSIPKFIGPTLMNNEAVESVLNTSSKRTSALFMVPLPKSLGGPRFLQMDELGDYNRKHLLLKDQSEKVKLWVELIMLFSGTDTECKIVEKLLTNDESFEGDVRLMHVRHAGGLQPSSKKKAVFLTIYHGVLTKVQEKELALIPSSKKLADKLIKGLPWLQAKDEHWVNPASVYEKAHFSEYLPEESYEDMSVEELQGERSVLMKKLASIEEELKKKTEHDGAEEALKEDYKEDKEAFEEEDSKKRSAEDAFGN